MPADWEFPFAGGQRIREPGFKLRSGTGPEMEEVENGKGRGG